MTQYDFYSTEEYNGKRIVYKDEKWRVIDKAQTEVIPLKYISIRSMSDGQNFCVGDIITANNEKTKIYGLIDNNGSQLLPIKYHTINNTNVKDVYSIFFNGKYGIFNVKLGIVIDCVYDSIYVFNNGFVKVKLDNLYGVYTITGEEIIPVESSNIQINLDHIKYEKHGKIGVINFKKETIIEAVYDELYDVNNVFICVKDNVYGLLSSTGKKLTEERYEYIYNLKGSKKLFLFKLYSNPRIGIMDNNGKIICMPKYDTILRLQQNIIFTDVDGKIGVIDEMGKEIVPNIYSDIEYSEEQNNLMYVNLDGKWGIITTDGTVITKPRYSVITPFCGNLALVKLKNKYAFINKQGKQIIAASYDEMNIYNPSYIYVKKYNKCGIIDCTGKVILPIKYDEICAIKENEVEVKLGGHVGTAYITSN